MKKNNKFFKENKIHIIIGGLFIVWAGFVFFIIVPSLKLLGNNFDAVQMKLLDQKVSNEKINKISSLKDEFSKVEEEKNSLEVIFSKNNIVELVNELESIAQKTGNAIAISVDEDSKTLQEVSKGKTAASTAKNELLDKLPTKNYLTMTIELTGDYNGLIEFINKMNSIKYYNSLVSFDLAAEKIVIKNDNKNSVSGAEVGIMSGNVSPSALPESESEKLILVSDLNVIFYSLENNEGKK